MLGMICRAAMADAAAIPSAAGGLEVKAEAQPAAQEQPVGDAAAAGAVDAAAGQPAEGQEVKQEGEGRGGRSNAPAQGVELGSFKLPADAILKQEIPLPRRMASCVIGIKGQSVSKLRRESGAKIHVRPAAGREEMDQVVEVEGSIEAVSAGICLRAGWQQLICSSMAAGLIVWCCGGLEPQLNIITAHQAAHHSRLPLHSAPVLTRGMLCSL